MPKCRGGWHKRLYIAYSQLFGVARGGGRIGGGRWGAIGALPITFVDNRLRDLVGKIVATVGASRRRAFLAIAQEAALDEHRRVLGFAQHTKIRRLNAAVYRAGQREQVLLNAVSQRARNGRMIISLESSNPAPSRVVEVHANENRVALSIRDGGALVEGNEDVVRPRHDDMKLRFTQFASEPSGDIERGIFFRAAITAKRAIVPAPVTGINHDRGECPGRVFDPYFRTGAATGQQRTRGWNQSVTK